MLIKVVSITTNYLKKKHATNFCTIKVIFNKKATNDSIVKLKI